MKTTKLFLSIALVALTVISFGMNNKTENIVFENELVMENWMSDPFEEMESDLVMENWMTVPFEAMDNDLVVENWMTSPFGLGTELEALTLESWMTTPFEATDDNCSGVLLAAACN
jgi:hypothetical protein